MFVEPNWQKKRSIWNATSKGKHVDFFKGVRETDEAKTSQTTAIVFYVNKKSCENVTVSLTKQNFLKRPIQLVADNGIVLSVIFTGVYRLSKRNDWQTVFGIKKRKHEENDFLCETHFRKNKPKTSWNVLYFLALCTTNI